MLLENHGGGNGSFEAMRFVSLHDFAKRSHRATLGFPVVRHFGQPALDLRRGVQTLNQIPLLFGKNLSAGFPIHFQANTRRVAQKAKR
jgi:hypothetical protein